MAERELSYYEVLEVDADASPEEIDAAYHKLNEVLGPQSLAMHAIPDDEEIERVRALVQQAHRTLSHPEHRVRYDRTLNEPPAARPRLSPSELPRLRLQPDAGIELTPETEFSGAMLRRLRESCQGTVDDVAEITKISRRYITALEEEDFDALPAAAYVRGFVAEYAKAMGLDQALVCKSYMVLYRKAGR